MCNSQLGITGGPYGVVVDSAIILAGGLGTRLRSAVLDLPKPMAPVNDRPFLEHQMDFWIGQGISRFILSVGYRRELVMTHFGSSYRGAAVEYAVEETPLGTGGGLLLARHRLRDDRPFLLLNGDTFFEVKLGDMAGFHAANCSEWTFSLFRTSEQGRYLGVDVNPAGRILSLKTGENRLERLANGGVYIVEPSVLGGLDWPAGERLSLEDDIVPRLFASGRRFWGYECSGRFIDIGVPEDYFRAAELLP